MKDAVLVYEPINGIQNIGDYIQSIAARQFCSEPVLYLNREHLDKYVGEKVRLIMNGWYMHNPDNWPPSTDIQPLPVAVHINSTTDDKLFSEQGFKWFKSNEPIGCRDYYTEHRLQEKGIDAYFSGCMTLTLGEKYKRNNPTDKVYFVDVPFYTNKRNVFTLAKIAFFAAFNFRTINRVAEKKYKHNGLKNFFRTAAFLKQYRRIFSDKVLLDAEYIEHNYECNHPDDFYFSEADNLLKKYANAKLVITSRIHCALPCTGFETPVVYVQTKKQEENSSCRLGGLIDLFNVITINKDCFEFEKEFDVNNPPINKTYKQLKDKLLYKCKAFVQE